MIVKGKGPRDKREGPKAQTRESQTPDLPAKANDEESEARPADLKRGQSLVTRRVTSPEAQQAMGSVPTPINAQDQLLASEVLN